MYPRPQEEEIETETGMPLISSDDDEAVRRLPGVVGQQQHQKKDAKSMGLT